MEAGLNASFHSMEAGPNSQLPFLGLAPGLRPGTVCAIGLRGCGDRLGSLNSRSRCASLLL